MNTRHLQLICQLLAGADAAGLPLWLQGGWAIDARLRRITREHDDVDIVFPAERQTEFIEFLKALGGGAATFVEYGFLIHVDGILLDCEPCQGTGQVYALPGLPAGNCPWNREGDLGGQPVRCVSWAAILWDFFYYMMEAPSSQWHAKHVEGYRVARSELGVHATARLHEQFRSHVRRTS